MVEELRAQQEAQQRGETQAERGPNNCEDAHDMIDEQRQKLLEQCAQEYGHMTPGRSETSTTTVASAAKKGLTSTSSSAGSTKPKRTIGKGRELHRRHSDGEVPTTAKKGLNDEFDKVMMVDKEGEFQQDEPA